MLVALADSLFLSIDPSAARCRVLLFLVISFAPFLVVAPLIGPAIDRAAGGRRTVIQLVAGTRVVLALLMAASLRLAAAVPARVRRPRAAEDVHRVEAGARAVRRALRGRARRGQLQARRDRRPDRLRGRHPGRRCSSCPRPGAGGRSIYSGALFALRPRQRHPAAGRRRRGEPRAAGGEGPAALGRAAAGGVRDDDPAGRASASCSSCWRSGCATRRPARPGSASPSGCRRSPRSSATPWRRASAPGSARS